MKAWRRQSRDVRSVVATPPFVPYPGPTLDYASVSEELLASLTWTWVLADPDRWHVQYRVNLGEWQDGAVFDGIERTVGFGVEATAGDTVGMRLRGQFALGDPYTEWSAFDDTVIPFAS